MDYWQIRYFLLVTAFSLHLPDKAATQDQDLKEKYLKGRAYMKQLEPKYTAASRKFCLVEFGFFIDVTNEKEQIYTDSETEYNKFQSDVQLEISKNFSWWKDLPCNALKREFRLLSNIGPGTLPVEKVQIINELKGKLASAFGRIKMCVYKNPKNCTLGSSDLDPIFRTSQDLDEVAHYINAYHDEINKGMSWSMYKELTDLTTEKFTLMGFKDKAEGWIESYNDDSESWKPEDFRKEMDDTWKELKPFYMKIHGYVRMKLGNKFGKDKVQDSQGHMFVHALKDIWAADWSGLASYTNPFPDIKPLDSTDALKKKGWDVMKLVKIADEYYQSIGLYPMNDNFYKKSQFERPKDRESICHPTASDMNVRTTMGGKKGDYRINMCATVSQKSLQVIHHEMGHIQYFMHYTHLHSAFRIGANPGFHEAIGDAMALGVLTPKHLQCYLKLDMGLDIDCNANSTGGATKPKEIDLNLLHLMALDKLSLLPFAYAVDTWRYDVFSGKISPEEQNNKWWEIRKETQGVVMQKERPAEAFDAGTKYHIVSDVGYIRYFISFIMQFQFFEALCKAAGEFDPNDPNSKPLYQCDFTGSKAAGKILRELMKLGASQPWPDAMQVLTGERKLSAKSLLNYFKPIFEYYDEQLGTANEKSCFGNAC